MHFSSNFPIFTGFSLLQMDTQALDQSFFLDSTSNSNFPNPWIPIPFNEFTRQFHVNPCHYKSFQTILLIYFLTFVKILIEVNLDSLPFIYLQQFFFTQISTFIKIRHFETFPCSSILFTSTLPLPSMQHYLLKLRNKCRPYVQ